MFPGLFKAAVADVPFVDVMNTMCDPSIPLTVTEWEEVRRERPLSSLSGSYCMHTAVYSKPISLRY